MSSCSPALTLSPSRNYRELVGEVFVIQGVPHVGVGKHRVRAARLVDRLEKQPAFGEAVGVRRSGGRRSRCEIRRKRPRGIAGSGRQALAAAKLPPVEDFKPSVLNQQGKWDLPLGRQRRSSPPSAPSSRDRKSTRLNSSHLGISYAV